MKVENQKEKLLKREFPVKILVMPDFSFNDHPQDRYRLYIAVRGIYTFKINDIVKLYSAPFVSCFNENDKVELIKEDGSEAYAAYFHPQFINKSLTFENINDNNSLTSVIDRLDSDTFHAFIHKKNDNGIIETGPSGIIKLKEMILKVKNELELQSDGFWPCRSRSIFLQALFYIMQLYHLPEEKADGALTDSGGKMNDIMHYIAANIKSRLTISAIAKEFGTNRTTLSKMFKDKTGYTVIDYINRLKVNLASRILKETGLTINQIMADTGFNDLTHFNRIFKRFMKCPPSEYRKKAKK